MNLRVVYRDIFNNITHYIHKTIYIHHIILYKNICYRLSLTCCITLTLALCVFNIFTNTSDTPAAANICLLPSSALNSYIASQAKRVTISLVAICLVSTAHIAPHPAPSLMRLDSIEERVTTAAHSHSEAVGSS